MEKINELAQVVTNGISELEKMSVAKIVELLNKREDNEMVFDTDEVEHAHSVCYDGDTKPEYNTNVFSVIQRVYLNSKKEVILDTEDEDAYSLQRAKDAQGGLVAYYLLKYMLEYIEIEKDLEE